MELYDLHCHIDLMPSMMSFAQEAGTAGIGILAVTTTPQAYEKETVALQPFTNIKVALGLHPQLVSKRYSELSLIENYIDKSKYIGEIGLDFNSQFYFSKEKQVDVFENIIRWCSLQGGKVISIHSIRSDKAVLDILENYRCTANNKCIFHWYSGTQAQLKRAIDMGCYFSINGAMIKSLNSQKLVKNIPLDKILLESDAPFVNGIDTVWRLSTELKKTEVVLSEFFGEGCLTAINNNSIKLLAMK